MSVDNNSHVLGTLQFEEGRAPVNLRECEHFVRHWRRVHGVRNHARATTRCRHGVRQCHRVGQLGVCIIFILSLLI